MSFVNTVDIIGDEALTSLLIYRSIAEIADSLVTSIGNYAFYGCDALTTVDFQKAAHIGSYSFYKCSALTTLVLRSETMVSVANAKAFNGTPIASGTGYIYVPRALVDSYKTATNWKTYANQFRALEDYPEVCTPKNTWEGVIARMDAGTYATDYAIGDTIPLDLGSEGVVNMQIAAFDTDDLADGSGKAKITFVTREVLRYGAMNPDAEETGDGTYEGGTGAIDGWESSDARYYMMNDLPELIPTSMANRIATVSKTHTAYDANGDSFEQTTEDALWIPSKAEVESTGAYGSLFSDDEARIRYMAGTEYGADWWLRSAGWYRGFHVIGEDGAYDSSYSAYVEKGYVLGFCMN